MSLTLSARAKVNIGLKITGQREDGYHTLETIFQEINLADKLILEKKIGDSTVTCSDPSIPTDETNLCLKAVEAFRAKVPEVGGVSIHLEKKIPVGAGLGGGSSDAASVLIGLEKLFELDLGLNILKELTISLGADVPFFLMGGCQHALGIGDELTPIILPPIGAIVLVCPPRKISTAWAYRHLKNDLSNGFSTGNFPILIEPHSSWGSLGALFENDFESLVFQAYPEIGNLKRRLIMAGAEYASLSGSGSTVFGIFEDSLLARNAIKQFSRFQTYLTSPILE